ncbi:hypothetical protein G5I_02505 [Acromyrmex echinatior]|uniref:Uncharacterized protein n=1 Tax=Acromyrmex echinatior TaxID=103372 RepID=F4WAG9_ACREC|nr:hypothetical protein G5I_02505 [Acromyrmex echinatior]
MRFAKQCERRDELIARASDAHHCSPQHNWTPVGGGTEPTDEGDEEQGTEGDRSPGRGLGVGRKGKGISISIGGINTTRRRVLGKHAINAEQELSPIRKKTKSIVSSPSPLFYAKSHLKLTQSYALTASSSGTQVVLYLERFQETGRRDELL